MQTGPSLGPRRLPKARSTNEYQRGSYATILLYAIARFGKTNLLRQLLKAGYKPLVLSVGEMGDSRGLTTVADLDIPVVEVDDWDTAKVVCAELKKGKYDGHEFDVIFNDSLTGFGYIWTASGLKALGWDEIGVAGAGKDTRQIYSYIPEKGRQTMNMLFDIPAHLVCICREGLTEEGEGKSKITYPCPELPGQKLNRELPGWPDAVVYGKFFNGKRVFLTEAEGKTIAGIRMPEGTRFPKYMQADLSLLIKGMKGDLDAIEASKIPSATPTRPTVNAK